MLNGRNLNLGKRGITLGLLARLIRYRNMVSTFNFSVLSGAPLDDRMPITKIHDARLSGGGVMSTATMVVSEEEGRR